MGAVLSWEVSSYGGCPVMGVSSQGECPVMGSAQSRGVSSYGKCRPVMGGVQL